LSSRAALAYMKALVSDGQRERAIRHGDTYAALVAEELNAKPDEEVALLTRRLREEQPEPAVSEVPTPLSLRPDAGHSNEPNASAAVREIAPVAEAAGRR